MNQTGVLAPAGNRLAPKGVEFESSAFRHQEFEMLRKETKRVEIDHVRVVEHTCDLCGCDMRNQAKNSYEVKESTVEVRDGNEYPEDCFGTTYTVDVCVNCMQTVVFPWLIEQGASVREEDY